MDDTERFSAREHIDGMNLALSPEDDARLEFLIGQFIERLAGERERASQLADALAGILDGIETDGGFWLPPTLESLRNAKRVLAAGVVSSTQPEG